MSDSVLLKDICETIVDCEHKTAPVQPTGYPSIRTPNIGRGRLILDNVNRVSEETYVAWTRREVPREDDLILAREAPVGNVAIIPPGLKVCLGQRTVLIRPDKDQVEPQYLLYLLLGDHIQGMFHSASTGATVGHLNVKDIRNLRLPALPPRSTQCHIAGILSAYDDLIENDTRRIKILEEMAQALYREWFVHFRFPGHEHVPMVDSPLGLIPEGWEVVRLGDVIELAYGKALKAADRDGQGFPVYGSSGVVGRHSKSLVDGPGVIVGRKGNVGSVFWEDDGFYPIDTVFFIRSHLSLIYVYYNLSQQQFINSDAAVPGLNRSQAYGLPFLLPSSDAVESFEYCIRPIFRQIRVLDTRNANLCRTQDYLLPKCVNGELSLDRIRTRKVEPCR